MKDLIDAFWRALAYCLHPRVILVSLLPVLIGAGLALGLAWLYWEPAMDAVQATLQGWTLMDAALKWIESLTGTGFRKVLAPLIVVVLAIPAVVAVSLLLVAVLMTPALVTMVAQRRFPDLQRRQGAGWLFSALWSLGCTLLALLALVLSLPLWLIPPLMVVVPPLIWGWLTFRVMSFDALASHADAAERRELLKRHHWPLLGMGMIAGYLGAAPTLLWAFSAMTLVFAPLLMAASIWLYTLIFAFSALWFTHYCLAALQRLRAEALPAVVQPGPVEPQAISFALPPLPPPGA